MDASQAGGNDTHWPKRWCQYVDTLTEIKKMSCNIFLKIKFIH